MSRRNHLKPLLAGTLASVIMVVATPHPAVGQEVSTEEIIARIRGDVGTEPSQGASAGRSRAIVEENDVDESEARRRPYNPPPPPPAQLPSPQPLSPTNCHEAVEFHLITFRLGSAEISRDPQTQATLRSLIAAFASGKLSNIKVYVRGHTDSTGSPATNLRLSRLRAEALAGRLIAAGGDARMILAAGMGSSMPLDPADPTNFRNRRVDICR